MLKTILGVLACGITLFLAIEAFMLNHNSKMYRRHKEENDE